MPKNIFWKGEMKMVKALPRFVHKGRTYIIDERLNEVRSYEYKKKPIVYRGAKAKSFLKKTGWFGEGARHSLARKGIKTGKKNRGGKKKEGEGHIHKEGMTYYHWYEKEAKLADLQPFALTHKEVKKGTGEIWQYDVLGQFHPKGEATGELYQEKYKGRVAKIEWMKPSDYFKKLGFEPKEAGISKTRVIELAKRMKAGDKFAMPWIEYWKEGKKTTIGHEGKHRVLAAKHLGIEKIPIVIAKVDPEKYADVEGWIRGKYKKKG